MSALTTTTADARRIDPAAWVRLDDAAARLGVNPGTLRRRCAAELLGRGLAVKIKAPGARNAAWWVSRSLDPALAGDEPLEPGDDAEPALVPALEVLERASGARRAAAEARATAVMLWRSWSDRGQGAAGGFAAYRRACHEACGLYPSKTTVYRWDAAAAGLDAYADVAAALLDGRSAVGRRVSACDRRCWELLEALYLDPSKPSLLSCDRRVRAYAEREGLAWPSYRRVLQLKAQRIAPERECVRREGAEVYQRLYERPLEQDPERFAPGERWESDHTCLDCFARRPVRGEYAAARPWLTFWYDWRSRMICGWHLGWHANADTIRAALLHALRSDGVTPPKSATLDNGKDFDSAQITGRTKSGRRRGEAPELNMSLLHHLGIEPHFALPYNHNGKGRIERAFGLLHEEVCKRSGAYCGNRPGDVAPEHRRRLLAAPEKLPTLDALRVLVMQYVAWHNNRTDHRIDDLVCAQTGERLCPRTVYLTGRTSVLPVSGDKLRLLEHRWYGPYTVTKRGVGVRLGGKTIRYYADAMRALVGTTRKLYVTVSADDLSVARVYDQQLRFVGLAHSELHGGTGTADVQDAMRRRREARRAARAKPDVDAVVYSVADLALQEARRREADRATAQIRERMPELPPNLRFHPSPLDAQADGVEAAERRLAAGGERDPEPRVDLADLYAGGDEPAAAGDLGLSLADLGDDDDGDGLGGPDGLDLADLDDIDDIDDIDDGDDGDAGLDLVDLDGGSGPDAPGGAAPEPDLLRALADE